MTLAHRLAVSTIAAPAQERVVNVYNWSDYIDPKMLEEFTQQTGIKVVYDTYDNNEIVETKLLAGRSGYDLVVPSGPFLQRLIKAKIFRPLDKEKLPNIVNLWPEIMQRLAVFDPGNQHAIDYMWGTTGLGINVNRVFALTFALGSGLAGLGGALGIDVLGLDPTFPLKYMVYFLLVVAVGGTGTIKGALIAALILGIFDVAGRRAPVSGVAIMTSSGVEVAVLVHNMAPGIVAAGGNFTQSLSGDELFNASGTFDSSTDGRSDGVVSWTNVDCRTLPAL